MKNKIITLSKMFLENCSPRYSEYVTSKYWNNTTKTHSDISDNAFNFYYEEIRKFISPENNEDILDYGCGSAEISFLFQRNGYRIDCCDISNNLVEKAKKVGLNAYHCNEILNDNKKYNKIFMNNAFFYIHPFNREKFLFNMFNKLKDKGTFFVLDEPDHNKRNKLKMNKIHYMLTNFLPIYQIESAGFFDNPQKMKQHGIKVGFTNVIIADSWCDYRSHFIFKK